MRRRRGGLGGAVLVIWSSLGGCSTESPVVVSDSFNQVDRQADALGEELLDCSRASVTGATPAYNASSKMMTIAFPATARSFVLQARNGQITVNGHACRTVAGLWLTTSNVQGMVVKGSSGDDVFVIDELLGSLASLGLKGGISLDGNGGTDSLSLRGTAGADNYKVASTGATTHYADLNNDKNADIKFTHTGNASMAVSMGKGNDTFLASILSTDITKFGGGGLSGTPGPTAISLDIYGGDGDDRLAGGIRDDRLFGDSGNDTFVSATVDGADEYDGGAGSDTVDYSGRKGPIIADVGLPSAYALGSADVSARPFPWTGSVTIMPHFRNVAQSPVTLPFSNAVDAVDLANKIATAPGSPIDVHLRYDGRLTFVLKDGQTSDGFTIGGGDASFLGFADSTTVVSQKKSRSFSSYNASNDGDIDANNGAGEGDDIQFSTENITGGDGNDRLMGNCYKNVLIGGKGDDFITSLPNSYAVPAVSNGDEFRGGDGDDIFFGGFLKNPYVFITGDDGFDVVSFRRRVNPVTIDLNDMRNSPGDGESGEFGVIPATVEKIIGTPKDDRIVGSARNETIVGGTGADVLIGGAGDDVIYPAEEYSVGYGGDNATDIVDGQDGRDTLFLGNQSDPLTIRICFTGTNPVANCPIENGASTETNLDLYANMEVTDLGDGDDWYKAPLLLSGAPNPDLTVYGSGGNDYITGGPGDDLLHGGSGTNHLNGAGDTGDICITDKGANDTRRNCELGDKNTAPECFGGTLRCSTTGATRTQACGADGYYDYGVKCMGTAPICASGACIAAPPGCAPGAIPGAPPMAQASAEGAGLAGRLLWLNAGASSDPEGNALTYTWRLVSQPGDRPTALNERTGARASFLPNDVGNYTFEVVANDCYQDSAPYRFTVNVAPGTGVVPDDCSIAGCVASATCVGGRCVGSGQLRFSATWTAVSDFDLHVLTPARQEIYYARRFVNGGRLDVDDCVGGSCRSPSLHVENIFFDWAVPPGTYEVWVTNYDGRAADSVSLEVVGVQNARFIEDMPARAGFSSTRRRLVVH